MSRDQDEVSRELAALLCQMMASNQERAFEGMSVLADSVGVDNFEDRGPADWARQAYWSLRDTPKFMITDDPPAQWAEAEAMIRTGWTPPEWLVDDVAERNARFAAASDCEKRVMVAQDVLQQLKAGTIVPTPGTYLDGCRVCAVGATFLSTCSLAGEDPSPPSWAREQNLRSWSRQAGGFPELQLAEMEAAFEGWNRHQAHHGTEAAWKFARDEQGEYLPADERMRRVMQNVIDNDGDFVIP